MRKLLLILPLISVFSLFAWILQTHAIANKNQAANIRDSIAKYKLDTKKVKLWIKKSDYTLQLFIDNKLVKTYPVVFGPDPVNDKKYEGDGCTPEGIYKIKAKYPHRSWSYFLWIDYPNEAAWKRFNENKKKGLIAKDATIGGDVGIHGVPFVTGLFGNHSLGTTPHNDDIISKRINWTLGCISLTTADITELYQYVSVGTEVEIVH
jgi:murein L,D-transpeptidase YafK